MDRPVSYRVMVLGLLGLGLLSLDQLSKLWAIASLQGHPPTVYLKILTLTYAENTGGWGSLGADWPPFARRMMLIAAPAIVLVWMGYYLAKNEEFDWTKWSGYVCVIAGGVGNLIDRFRLDHVVDFLYIGYGPIGTNIFNIADMAILAGFSLVLYGSYRQPVVAAPESETGPQTLESRVEGVGGETQTIDPHGSK